MDLDHLWYRYFRLKRALSTAYQASCWRSQRIDRLADALADTERDIAACQGVAPDARRRDSLLVRELG